LAKFTVAILTVSDRVSRGEMLDLSGHLLREIITREVDAEVVVQRVVPDDPKQIIWELQRFIDNLHVDLVLTTGGTGLTERDVTPEATAAVIERRVPGLEEAMRMEGFKETPHALLSRAIVGTRGKGLIINLPGNPKGAEQNLRIILPALPHALSLLKGRKLPDEEHRFRH